MEFKTDNEVSPFHYIHLKQWSLLTFMKIETTAIPLGLLAASL